MNNDQQHTAEPWRVSGSGTMRFIDAPAGNGVVQEVATCMRVEYGGMHANARRIVACVNACAGVSTGDLETAPGYKAAIEGFHEQRAAKLSAEAQRDLLLAALELLTDAVSANCDADQNEMAVKPALKRARAAIAATRGE